MSSRSNRDCQGLVTTVDIVEPETRSRMMAGIRGRDTKPEIVVRKALHAAGFRYRLHDGRLPGRPDIVLQKWKAVVLVHGCFWHRHAGCRYTTTPASNQIFWEEKFAQNVRRDQRDHSLLEGLGWRIAIVWECGLKSGRGPSTVAALANWLRSAPDSSFSLPHDAFGSTNSRTVQPHSAR